jgi:hypothetical protein
LHSVHITWKKIKNKTNSIPQKGTKKKKKKIKKKKKKKKKKEKKRMGIVIRCTVAQAQQTIK